MLLLIRLILLYVVACLVTSLRKKPTHSAFYWIPSLAGHCGGTLSHSLNLKGISEVLRAHLRADLFTGKSPQRALY